MYRGYLKSSEGNDLVAIKTGKGTYHSIERCERETLGG